MRGRLALRALALGYLGLLLALPVALVFWRAFEKGVGPAWEAITTPQAMHALWLTCVMVAVAVPLNTLFGVLCAFLIVRQRFRGRTLLSAAVDLPFAVSPVVVGLALLLVYGRDGWVGGWLAEQGIQVIFSPARHPCGVRAAEHDPGDDLRLPPLRRARGGAGPA
jgi:sulfate transport system permease protein